MGGPDGYQQEIPLVGVRGASAVYFVNMRRLAGVVIDPVLVAPTGIDGQFFRLERKGRDLAPFRAEEFRGAQGDHIAALIDEHIEGQGLPAVGVQQVGVAGGDGRQRRVGGNVVLIGITVLLVGAILKAEIDQVLGDVVAQRRRRSAGIIRGGKEGVVAQLDEKIVKLSQGSGGARRIQKPVMEQAVGGIADRFFAGSLDIIRRGDVFKRAGKTAHGFTQEIGLCFLIVNRPGVVHGDGGVKQVAGVHRRTGKILPDRIQQNLVPLPGDGVLAKGR